MSWETVKRARERLSQEKGTAFKDWGGRLPIALIYPNSYYVGMSNLGLHAIYRMLNHRPDVVCERVFWEPGQAGAPFSIESQRPLRDFAVLAFSISYELDYLNIAPLLRASGIPPFAADRDESHPLAIAGGACIITNPMPVAPFFDCLGIGEAEALLPGMLRAISEGIGGSREELLGELARLPGVFVPQRFYGNPVIRQWAQDLDEEPVSSAIVTSDTELGNLFLIEVERGCGWGCRFCLVSSAFRPMRWRSLDTLIAQAGAGLGYGKRLGLVGPAVTAHPQIEELVGSLSRMGAKLSVSSLRVKPFSDAVLEALATTGAKTITLAPEAGSERLRQVIKKGITEDDILKAVDSVAARAIKNLKLYFMVGLPTETDQDIEEIIELCLRCKSLFDKRRSGCRITANMAPFVPKAGTPFQRLGMAPVPVLNQRLARLRAALPAKGIIVKSESPAWSEVQAVLSRGDARLAQALAALKKASLSEFRRSLEASGIDTDFYAHQRWGLDTKLPWSVIDSGISESHLESELERALA